MMWTVSDFKCKLRVNGQEISLTTESKGAWGYVDCVVQNLAYGKRMTWYLYPTQEVVIQRAQLRFKNKVSPLTAITFNGYQSWTDTQPLYSKDAMPSLSWLAKPIMKKYQFDKYGDTTIKAFKKGKGHFHGFTYVELNHHQGATLIASCDEKSGFTIIEYQDHDGQWTISKDNEGLHVQKETVCLDVVVLNGPQSAVFDVWAQAMNIEKPKTKPHTGWTSWYYHYQNINESIIKKNVIALAKADLSLDIIQIDDGYQQAIGDWLDIDPTKFENGMSVMADMIHDYGFKAGLWLAPCVCQVNSALAQRHPHWLVKDELNQPILGGSNWGGFYVLDMQLQEVKDYIKHVFDVVLNQWGYDMVKLDFLYAACLRPTKDKSRGQLMHETMVFLRECAGNKLILGCGVPLASAFGLVDFCRIGCDVGLDYNDRWYMKYMHRERISTYHSINNALGRYPLHQRFFLNDPDVILLRSESNQLTSMQRTTLARVNKLSHGLLFTSDDISTYDALQHNLFAWCMNRDDIHIQSLHCIQKGVYHLLVTVNQRSQAWWINTENKPIRLPIKTLQPFESYCEVYHEHL